MIKYIINSGGSSWKPDKLKIFAEELLKDLPDNPKILLCFFAQAREDWERKYSEKLEGLKKVISSEIGPKFDMAMPDTFVKQSAESDAIIIYGGDDHLIQYWLKQFDVPKIWDNKTISVSSASSNALVTYFWTCDWRENKDGMGILKIKFIPHYKSAYGDDDPRGPIDWDKAYDELKNYKDKNLAIHALEEGQFIVIKQ